jgi:FAD synthetase
MSSADRQCSLELWRCPLGGPIDSPDQIPIIALGKFDALHRGHQALAAAAAQCDGMPWLVSFAGMAEVLRWPTRLPLVALADRRRVMETWKDACGGKTPTECAIPFAEVRSLPPEEFVALLANELKIGGVAVGSNYRFGYKAAGDANLLKTLGEKYGLKVAIVDLVEHEGELQGEVVSSSWVREALAEGDVAAAAYCLGRPYRLILENASSDSIHITENANKFIYANQPPAVGQYNVLAHVVKPGEAVQHVSQGSTAQVVLAEHGEILVDINKELIVAPQGGMLVLDFLEKF